MSEVAVDGVAGEQGAEGIKQAMQPYQTEGDGDMELRCGQVTLDVFDPSSIGQPFAPSPAGLALRVADVDAARAELESKGVVFDGDTIVTSVCKQAWFKDPDGNALMLHRRFDV